MTLKEINELSDEMGYYPPSKALNGARYTEYEIKQMMKACTEDSELSSTLRGCMDSRLEAEWWRWMLILYRRKHRKKKAGP